MSSVAYLLLWTATPHIPTKARRDVYARSITSRNSMVHPFTDSPDGHLYCLQLPLLSPRLTRATELEEVLPRWTALH